MNKSVNASLFLMWACRPNCRITPEWWESTFYVFTRSKRRILRKLKSVLRTWPQKYSSSAVEIMIFFFEDTFLHIHITPFNSRFLKCIPWFEIANFIFFQKSRIPFCFFHKKKRVELSFFWLRQLTRKLLKQETTISWSTPCIRKFCEKHMKTLPSWKSVFIFRIYVM